MVRSYFPGAMRNEDAIKGVVHIAEGLGMNEVNTLFAYSVCPDEINHDHADLAYVLHNHFGPSFSLGGLGGIPFSGKTGFGAYASHVPDDGYIFVLFAPHCAVSPKTYASDMQFTPEEHICGYYHRLGQKQLSTACGACLGAYKAVKNMDSLPQMSILSRDSQMDYIKQLLYENKPRIAAASNAAREITDIMFEHIRDYIMDIVDYEKFIKHRKIALLGGIQINVQPDDYFEPRVFIVLDDHGTHDHLEELLSYDKICVKDQTVPVRRNRNDMHSVVENVKKRLRPHSTSPGRKLEPDSPEI